MALDAKAVQLIPQLRTEQWKATNVKDPPRTFFFILKSMRFVTFCKTFIYSLVKFRQSNFFSNLIYLNLSFEKSAKKIRDAKEKQ